MALQLFNGVVADNAATVADKIKVSVPDLGTANRHVYGPLPFVPNVDEDGITLPQAGDKAVISVDEGTGAQLVIFWYRTGT
jgi:hypothetical protein